MGDGKAEAENLIGSRIGQLVLKKLEPFEIKVSEQLSDSDRGEGGFGSSGS
jgi:dUTPase